MASESEELNSWVFTVEESLVGERCDRFLVDRLADVLPGITRAKVQRLIDGGSVTLNGNPVRGSAKLRLGDQLTVTAAPVLPEPAEAYLGRTPQPVNIPLDILFEDDHVIVINKPAGLNVHGGAGETGPTLVDALLAHCGELGQAAQLSPLTKLRPGIVRRLDKGTTGAIVCAKTDVAHAALSRQFQEKTTEREYAALLNGRLATAEVTIESYLFRDGNMRTAFASMPVEEHRKRHGDVDVPGHRFARSKFTRDTDLPGGLTLAAVRLATGRTHQIRVHAKALGAPVLGDPVYGRPPSPSVLPPAVRSMVAGLTRQMLHARLLSFDHPQSLERLSFEAPYPKDFLDLLILLADQ